MCTVQRPANEGRRVVDPPMQGPEGPIGGVEDALPRVAVTQQGAAVADPSEGVASRSQRRGSLTGPLGDQE